MKPRDDATPEVPIPATHAAQQVAYAWQAAARDLRFSHPELHAQLTERVRKLLDVEVLVAPSREILQAVVEGTRTLTHEEREWCVNEAMVLTGFLKTPVELLQSGEPALARIILDGSPG
ncbi:hypothetical protein [Noviluteimonas gilva]|uniref:Uncharacterized protein n=1 Tax=Noviluteimonas gilva TaxID=2682097 RepID=A0A7C9HKU2_9GAMM|nr:hypothetical protein [Lysobacter gilvus]MUV13096.1 hypothetical protein [Lysobacter gilvus]